MEMMARRLRCEAWGFLRSFDGSSEGLQQYEDCSGITLDCESFWGRFWGQ